MFELSTSFVFGLIIGSFFNACIYRLPREITLTGRSFCPHCHHRIDWWQNIPILSFLFLRGKCHYCREKISIRYPLVELGTGIITVVTFYFSGWTVELALYLVFIYSLIVISLIDMEFGIIPNKMLIFMAISGLLLNLVFNTRSIGGILINSLITGLIFLSIYFLSYFFLKKEGLGMGDVKLAFVAGLFVDWKLILIALFIASSCALLIVGLQYFIWNKKVERIPFSPFLSIGFIFIGIFPQISHVVVLLH